MVLHSFVINRIDYCNSVLYGMSAVNMRPLQNVLNSAARVVLKMPKFQHITAAVRDQLHWLPVKQRVATGVQAGVIHVQGPPSDSSTVPCGCWHVSTRVNEFHATPSSLGRSRGSCGAAMQNNNIRKAKFSRVFSINLELTTDDRSLRFYFNDQLQWTFESCTVSQSLRNWLSAYVHDSYLLIVCANINILTYLLARQFFSIYTSFFSVCIFLFYPLEPFTFIFVHDHELS